MLGQLTGVLTKTGPRKFTATCLELGLNTEGISEDDARDKLITAVQLHINSICETRQSERSSKRIVAPIYNSTKKHDKPQIFEIPSYLILH